MNPNHWDFAGLSAVRYAKYHEKKKKYFNITDTWIVENGDIS
jgi:hypothetical protein